jgi:hypothetical protein
LEAFLAQATARVAVWGQWDCHLWLADWIVAATDAPDPAADFRGRYRTALGAKRLLKREGGSPALVARLAARAGLADVDLADVRAGDIGLMPICGIKDFHFLGVLRTERRWCCLRWPAGIAAIPDRAAKAWRLPCR